MAKYELNNDILKIVENQIISNNPTCTRLAFNQIMEIGYEQLDTLEMIGTVLVEEMNQVMLNGREFNEASYALELERLVSKCKDLEPDAVSLDPIEEAKYAGYECLMRDDKEGMAKNWLTAFKKVKELLADQFPKNKVEVADLDEKTQFKYGLMNWLEDIQRELGNANMHQERIQYCQEVLDLFAWKKDAANEYHSGIGEAYAGLKDEAKCKEWFRKWLSKEPGNPYAIEAYLHVLMDLNELEEAKTLVEANITDDMECDLDNETLFLRVTMLYQLDGQEEKAMIYKRKTDAFHAKCLDMAKKYEEKVIPFHKRKGKKVYPNDPCPCGSGKKFKNCCGKK